MVGFPLCRKGMEGVVKGRGRGEIGGGADVGIATVVAAVDSGAVVRGGFGLDLHHVQLAAVRPGHATAGTRSGGAGSGRRGIGIGAQRPERGPGPLH